MATKKPSAPRWQEVPGAQEVMDRALSLAAAGPARAYGQLAAVVFETALLFTNADGLPDLRRESYLARRWMSDLLDAAGYKPVPGMSKEMREKLAKDRTSMSQGIRAAMSQVRVDYLRGLDNDPAERDRRFSAFGSSDAIFDYYRIVPQARNELQAGKLQALQAASRIGQAVEDGDLTIPPLRSPQVVRTFRQAIATLSPEALACLDRTTADQLREELAETRAALLALEESLS